MTSSEFPLPIDLSSPCKKRQREILSDNEESPKKYRILSGKPPLKIYTPNTPELHENNHPNSPKKHSTRIKDLSRKIRKPSLGILSPKRKPTPAKKNTKSILSPKTIPLPKIIEKQTNNTTTDDKKESILLREKLQTTLVSELSTTCQKRNSLLLLHNQEKKRAFQEALRSPPSKPLPPPRNPVIQTSSTLSSPPGLHRSISLYSLSSDRPKPVVKKSPRNRTSTTPRPPKPKRKKKSSVASVSLSLRNSRKRSVTDFKQLFSRGISQTSLQSESDEYNTEDEKEEITKRYFSSNLEEIMSIQRTLMDLEHLKIPYFIDVACKEIRKSFLLEEGLFRVSPSLTELENAINSIESCNKFGYSILNNSNNNTNNSKPIFKAHVFSGIIKKFLRDLPSPLLGIENYDLWISYISSNNSVHIKDLVCQLPTDSYYLLDAVISLSKDLSDHKKQNLMSIENLSRVIGPNILWNKHISDPLQSSEQIALVNQITQHLITNYDDIFKNKKSSETENIKNNKELTDIQENDKNDNDIDSNDCDNNEINNKETIKEEEN